jgi:metal-responsive CopG/Arc/MetJ family transcriptional regulator
MCVVHCTSMTSSTIAAATMDMTVKLGITLPKSIIQKIDNKRGDIPRSRYIRRVIERYLGNNSSKDIDNKDNYNKATKSRRI